ncbi:MAG: autotransporter outer membrane beta-barrel domain-containing protein [Magnetococcales bacterium]|nr:autotransporter outer membrane beta-barrel domain-containing protein [Magnetococcales bacterium]MBF0116678.1 autotransporter outer membrane beta-barrel domain-containing protein [Magnetococcales bacterium]
MISNAISGGFSSFSGGIGGGNMHSQVTPGVQTTQHDSHDENRPVANFSFSHRGLSAGENASPVRVWGQGNYTHYKVSEPALETKGDLQHYVLGGDYRLTPSLQAGLALSWEDSDNKTLFNSGTLTSDGLSVLPYLGIAINNEWTADLSLGYSWLNYDVSHTSNTITGTFDAHRSMASANLVGNYARDKWLFQPKMGLLYVEEKQDSYTESDGGIVLERSSKLGRLSAGSKIGYTTDFGIPYVKMMGEWDFKTPDSILTTNGQYSQTNRGGAVFGGGYEIHKGNLAGSLEINNSSLFRDNLEIWTVGLRVDYQF